MKKAYTVYVATVKGKLQPTGGNKLEEEQYGFHKCIYAEMCPLSLNK
jgi:hypothetical protein